MDREGDEVRRERAIELRAAGWTVEAIKRELRVGSTKVSEWLSGAPAPLGGVRQSKWSGQRHLAHERRLRGESYRQIQEALGIPKSTLSSWLRDVPLTDEHRAHLAARQVDGIRSRAEAIRAARIRRTEELESRAASEVGSLTARELFLVGVAAYWCEGSKAKPWQPSRGVTFINSDASLILLFIRWLELLGFDRSELEYRLSIHESADVDAATRAWSATIAVPGDRFARPSLKRHNPTTRRRNTEDGYLGCLIVRVRRSTDLNRRIAGWWAGIAAASQGSLSTIDGNSGMV